MSAISSHDLDGFETSAKLRSSRKPGFAALIITGLALAPCALVAIGLLRGGVEPYMILAAWLLG